MDNNESKSLSYETASGIEVKIPLPSQEEKETAEANRIAVERARINRLHIETKEGKEVPEIADERTKVVTFTCSMALYRELMGDASEFLENGRPNISKAARLALAKHYGLSSELADADSFKKIIKDQ